MLSSSRHAGVRAASAALVTLVLFLGVTAWIWSNVESDVMRMARQAFDFRVSQTRFSVRQRLAAYEQALRGGVGLFQAGGIVDREAWHAYVQALHIDVNYPGIQGLGFALRIPPQELEAHIHAIRAQGFPKYTVTPPGRRGETTAIIYLEPFDWRNQRAFGYDMFSESVRREAMARARDTGVSAASGKVTLVQETSGGVQNGFLMYSPVYRKDAPLASAAQRQSSLIGYVYAPFRMNDLMQGVLGNNGLFDIGLQIFDGEQPSTGSDLYDSVAGTPAAQRSGSPVFVATEQITFGGRVWTLHFVTLAAFEAKIDKQKPRLILVCAALISGLMAAVVWILLLSRQHLRRLALANEALTREINRRTRLEAELKQAKEVAEVANQAKSDSLANVSHELRTPLTLILGPLRQLVAANEPPPDWQMQLARLQRNALRLLNRVNELLDFAKVEAGKISVRCEAVDLAELITTLIRDAEAAAASKGCTLTASIDPELAAVWMDREHLERILLNLLANALKFTPDGGSIHIEVGIVNQAHFFVTVSDSGIGIAPEAIDQLFKRFGQIDTSITRRYGGTGIGLALVKELTQCMGGQIAVSSVPGEGAQFRVTLPRGVQRCSAVTEAAPGAAAPDSEASLQSALRHARFMESSVMPVPVQAVEAKNVMPRNGLDRGMRRILVADDNPDICAYIADLLSPEWDVICAEDGAQAWEILKRHPVDLLISDVMMPVLDGLNLTERVKACGQLRHIPVILLTARGDSDAHVLGLRGGADDFLSKPFEPEELRARVQAAARMSQIQAELREKSREAGMAMVASGILHNLANVLSGLTAGSALMHEQLERSSLPKLCKVTALLQEHATDLPGFFSRNDNAAVLPAYLGELTKQLSSEHEALCAEVKVLTDCTDHARQVIASHQQLVQPITAMNELVSANSMMDGALALASAAFDMNAITVERQYDNEVNVVTDQHKVLQILINLLGNAVQALSGGIGSGIILKTSRVGEWARMEVIDNGVGIAPEHIPVLFNQRFTTREGGNGIGLHSSANWARELGGQLTCRSDGPGKGATFVVELPTGSVVSHADAAKPADQAGARILGSGGYPVHPRPGFNR